MVTLRELGHGIEAASHVDPRHRLFATLSVKLVLPIMPRAA